MPPNCDSCGLGGPRLQIAPTAEQREHAAATKSPGRATNQTSIGTEEKKLSPWLPSGFCKRVEHMCMRRGYRLPHDLRVALPCTWIAVCLSEHCAMGVAINESRLLHSQAGSSKVPGFHSLPMRPMLSSASKTPLLLLRLPKQVRESGERCSEGQMQLDFWALQCNAGFAAATQEGLCAQMQGRADHCTAATSEASPSHHHSWVSRREPEGILSVLLIYRNAERRGKYIVMYAQAWGSAL